MQGGVGSADAVKLTLRDVEAIRDLAPHVAGVNYQQDRRLPVVWRTKTASVHVSRILAKLDVRSRTEAAAVAHRLGLAEEAKN